MFNESLVLNHLFQGKRFIIHGKERRCFDCYHKNADASERSIYFARDIFRLQSLESDEHTDRVFLEVTGVMLKLRPTVKFVIDYSFSETSNRSSLLHHLYDDILHSREVISYGRIHLFEYDIEGKGTFISLRDVFIYLSMI